MVSIRLLGRFLHSRNFDNRLIKHSASSFHTSSTPQNDAPVKALIIEADFVVKATSVGKALSLNRNGVLSNTSSVFADRSLSAGHAKASIKFRDDLDIHNLVVALGVVLQVGS